ncbi:MAG TPA: hypothetical protein VM513_05300 [Kofleriaceae bacterium]|jgi:hypothetical protein|nr:hypothetical protein [Kofleriaceae bacterium]
MGTQPKNFRITLWFKLGALAESVEAETEEAPSDTLLPVEDRYLDDGSVTSADSKAFSLRSGRTQALALDTIALAPTEDDGALDHLVREMKRGRRTLVAALGGVAVALCGVLMFTL